MIARLINTSIDHLKQSKGLIQTQKQIIFQTNFKNTFPFQFKEESLLNNLHTT